MGLCQSLAPCDPPVELSNIDTIRGHRAAGVIFIPSAAAAPAPAPLTRVAK